MGITASPSATAKAPPDLSDREPETLAAVRSVLYPTTPLPIFEVPLDGLAHAGLKALRWRPAQLTLNLARIDRIPTVMARAILDVGDKLQIAGRGFARQKLIEQRAD